MKSASLDHLHDCEHELATAVPFGGWRSISNRNLTFYEGAVELLAHSLPAVQALRNQLQTATVRQRFRLFGDPTVRTALNELLAAAKAGERIDLDEPNSSRSEEETSELQSL